MITFKGRSSLKQYLPLKPIKRGYRVWCICDPVTGYLFNFQIYLGNEEISGNETSLNKRVVFGLTFDHNFQGKYLYFDNFFTSLRRLENLKLQNIEVCGTIRADRGSIPSTLPRKIRWKEEIANQYFYRTALSSHGWTPNRLFLRQILLKTTKLFRFPVF